ncbi:unnamed protein product [Cladocopium goreaui]|uniref:SMB domain-containing protein n=1 Tax=Cladocopium goreaui TaxID=2562237 RepID=A0A9P1GSS7_9DINO|nr:unnamed protein product [Cladocopium goreaui]
MGIPISKEPSGHQESLRPFPWSRNEDTAAVPAVGCGVMTSDEPMICGVQTNCCKLVGTIDGNKPLDDRITSGDTSFLEYKLPPANATAGKVLLHAKSIVNKLFAKHCPMIFKIGYSHNPVFRWNNELYGYKFSRDKWTNMVVLFESAEVHGPAFLVGQAAEMSILEESFNTIQKRLRINRAPAGICHLCRSGQPDVPFEQLETRRPSWIPTQFTQDPFAEPSPFTEHLLHEEGKEAAFWTYDWFHTMHLGVIRNFVGSAIAMLTELEPYGNKDERFSAFTRKYRSWCHTHSRRAYCTKITKESIGWEVNSKFPSAQWHKGGLSTVMMEYIESVFRSQTFPDDELLTMTAEACFAVQDLSRILYRSPMRVTAQAPVLHRIMDRYLQSAYAHFIRIYENVYKGPGLDGKPWLSVLGNHDWGGREMDAAWDQQIAYTWVSKRWVLPAPYWMQTVDYVDQGFTVEILMIDSNIEDADEDTSANPEHNICGKLHNPPGSSCAKIGGPSSIESCHDWFQKLWDEGATWATEKLQKSEADWQIMVTHFPCGHKTKFYKEMHLKYGLDLLVTGHAHYQLMYWSPEKLGGLKCFITGGGGGITSENNVEVDNPDDHQYGFFDLTMTKESIKIESINWRGNVIETETVEPYLGTETRKAELEPCVIPKPGSDCYKVIQWAMKDGIHSNPEWFPGLTSASPVAKFQEKFYKEHKDGCGKPCDA